MLGILMLCFLIVCAITVSMLKDLLGAIIIFMIYSLVMALIWQQLSAPDIAITEAAIGSGVTTLLFILALRRINRK